MLTPVNLLTVIRTLMLAASHEFRSASQVVIDKFFRPTRAVANAALRTTAWRCTCRSSRAQALPTATPHGR